MEASTPQRLSPYDSEQLEAFCLAFAFASEERRRLAIGRSHIMQHRIGRVALGVIIIGLATVGAWALHIPPWSAAAMLIFGILVGIIIAWSKP